jgi:hypothetical protein
MRTTPLAAACAALLSLAACQDQSSVPTAPERSPRPPSAPEGFQTRGEVRTGWILGSDGKPLEIVYEVIEGRAIWQGDINLTRADSIARTREELLRPGAPRFGVATAGNRWPGGVVPYVAEAGTASRVNWAIAEIHSKVPGVRFVPRTSESSYLYVRGGSGCSSDALGRKGNVQYVTLGAGCSNGNTAHELLHVLGLGHEQSRCDRANYVDVNDPGVQQVGLESQFTLLCPNAYTLIDEYDEGSIMHYPSTYQGVLLMTSKRGRTWQMGQRDGLSAVDVRTVDWMYPAPFVVTDSYPGGTPTLTWAPYRDAYQYDVYLVTEEEVDDVELGYSSSTRRDHLGTVYGTSFTHSGRAYTGVSNCYRSDYLRQEYIGHHYEVIAWASVPGGQRVGSASALIANC